MSTTPISSIHWRSPRLKELAFKRAKKRNQSLSAYVRGLVEKDMKTNRRAE